MTSSIDCFEELVALLRRYETKVYVRTGKSDVVTHVFASFLRQATHFRHIRTLSDTFSIRPALLRCRLLISTLLPTRSDSLFHLLDDWIVGYIVQMTLAPTFADWDCQTTPFYFALESLAKIAKYRRRKITLDDLRSEKTAMARKVLHSTTTTDFVGENDVLDEHVEQTQ